MKNLRTAVLCAGVMLASFASFSQEGHQAPINQPDRNKPKLFVGMPDKVQVNTDVISGLFSTSLGQATSINLTEDGRSQFQGELISSGALASNVQNIVIRSTNFNGATLSVTRIIKPDGPVLYRGRIISFTHGDVYVLENQDGRYSLVKKNFYDLVNE